MKLTLYKRILNSQPLRKSEGESSESLHDTDPNEAATEDPTLATNSSADASEEAEGVLEDEIFVETKGDVIITSPPFKLNYLSSTDKLVVCFFFEKKKKFDLQVDFFIHSVSPFNRTSSHSISPFKTHAKPRELARETTHVHEHEYRRGRRGRECWGVGRG